MSPSGVPADERLAAFLGAPPPDAVAALPEADKAALADVLDDARRAQTRALGEAFDAALKHVPFPVRGVVRKVLTG